MINVEQCRGARALLGWSAQELADQAGMGVATVRRYEGGGKIAPPSLVSIADTLIAAGIDFIGQGESSPGGGAGVRLKD